MAFARSSRPSAARAVGAPIVVARTAHSANVVAHAPNRRNFAAVFGTVVPSADPYPMRTQYSQLTHCQLSSQLHHDRATDELRCPRSYLLMLHACVSARVGLAGRWRRRSRR